LGRPVVHLEIIGKDPAKLRKFYAELFDWKFGDVMGPEMGHYSLVQPDSSGIGVGVGSEMGGSGNRTTAYVEVPDLKATLDQAAAMGGKILMEPMEIPGVVTMAMFADPEGNVIGLTKTA
jgi:predicted enzyme related to lactoylglutathione lyase